MKSNSPQEFAPKFRIPVRRQEAELAGFMCSRRGCSRPAFGPVSKKTTNLDYDEDSTSFPRGEAAHIFSSSPNGPRGQGGLSQEKLAGLNNCFHACPNCHSLIDSADSTYTVDKLVEMKWLHRHVVKVMNLFPHLRPRLLIDAGDKSERYKFEEFLLNKVVEITRPEGAVPFKPKIDNHTLMTYVHEFFSEKLPLRHEFSIEEQKAAHKKLHELMNFYWSKPQQVNVDLEFCHSLYTIRESGERIPSGETYRKRIRIEKQIPTSLDIDARSAELSHTISFDIWHGFSTAEIEFCAHRVRISTNCNTASFLKAVSEKSRIYYEVRISEIVDGTQGLSWILNKGEAIYRWQPSYNFFAKLEALNTQCLLTKNIAAEFGLNFLPSFTAQGVRPCAVSGLLAPGLTKKILRKQFACLKDEKSETIITLRSSWALEKSNFMAHLNCSLKFSKFQKNCNLVTHTLLMVTSKEDENKPKAYALSFDELLTIDHVIEMEKPELKGVIRERLEQYLNNINICANQENSADPLHQHSDQN